MALIDKQAAMDCCFKPKVTPGGAIFDALKMAIRNEIEALQEVEAVPLDALCKMLSENLNYPPCEDNLVECHKCELTQKYGSQRECWEKYLRKWMEGQK